MDRDTRFERATALWKSATFPTTPISDSGRWGGAPHRRNRKRFTARIILPWSRWQDSNPHKLGSKPSAHPLDHICIRVPRAEAFPLGGWYRIRTCGTFRPGELATHSHKPLGQPSMESIAGIEPAYTGFAIPRLTPRPYRHGIRDKTRTCNPWLRTPVRFHCASRICSGCAAPPVKRIRNHTQNGGK